MKEPIWTLAFFLTRVVGVGIVAIAYAVWPTIPMLVLFITIFTMSLLVDIALHLWNS